MVITKDVWLPTEGELDIPEITLTSGPLVAAAHHLGKYCDNQCKDYMLCWQESLRDPRACLKEGKEVTQCGLEFFRKVKQHCSFEFAKYFNCVEKYTRKDMNLEDCRTQQQPFDDCIKKNLGQDRPEFGYFSRVRIHETSRPKPEMKLAPMPEPIPDLPDLPSMQDPEDLDFKKRRINFLP